MFKTLYLWLFRTKEERILRNNMVKELNNVYRHQSYADLIKVYSLLK